jgi:tetratricopeptide (TPR) repeat protein
VASSDTFRAQVLISQAKLLEERGDLEEAVEILQRAHEISLPAGDERVLLCVRHNLADNLSKLDRFREADALLPEIRVLSRKAGGELDRIRLRWTEGRVVAGLGNVEKGIQTLTKVRGEFASHDMVYDTALVSLELSAFHARQGRVQEVKSLARHMVPIFSSQEMHREALAALLVFREAAEKEQVTAELAREILLYLRKARHNPELRFESGLL